MVDELNQESPLERRELPVVFIKQKHYTPSHKVEYPPRDIPPVIKPGTLMWWSIDDVFEQVINPGYGLFATADNVAEYGGLDVSSDNVTDATASDSVDAQFDTQLQVLLQNSTLVSSRPVSREVVLQYLRTELNLFVSSDKSVLLTETLSKPGEYLVPLKINSEVTENLKVVVS